MNKVDDEFLKTNPYEIMSTLQELEKKNVTLRLSVQEYQCVSRILSVTRESVILDFVSRDFLNKRLLEANEVSVSTHIQSAKVEFVFTDINTITYEGKPAFVIPLPESIWYIQRREFFRISTPVNPPCRCVIKHEDNEPLIFRLCDLSLGGIGAELTGDCPEWLQPAMVIKNATIDLAEHGEFTVDMQVICISEREFVGHKNEVVTVPRVSLRFMNMGPASERQLQRAIFALEREAYQRAKRIADS